MRHNSRINPGDAKRIARQKYAERQIDKVGVSGAGMLKVKLDTKS